MPLDAVVCFESLSSCRQSWALCYFSCGLDWHQVPSDRIQKGATSLGFCDCLGCVCVCVNFLVLGRWFFCLFCFSHFETCSYCVAQAGLKFCNLFCLSLGCWDYGCVHLCPCLVTTFPRKELEVEQVTLLPV